MTAKAANVGRPRVMYVKLLGPGSRLMALVAPALDELGHLEAPKPVCSDTTDQKLLDVVLMPRLPGLREHSSAIQMALP